MLARFRRLRLQYWRSDVKVGSCGLPQGRWPRTTSSDLTQQEGVTVPLYSTRQQLLDRFLRGVIDILLARVTMRHHSATGTGPFFASFRWVRP